MARQNLNELGFRGDANDGVSQVTATAKEVLDEENRSEEQSSDVNQRKREGFIAGVRRS